MKEYTNTQPEFSKSIQVVETTDPAHADNINAATKQLLQNTLANRQLIGELLGFSYEGNGLIQNIIGCSYDNGTLVIPASLASVEGGVITLSDGII